MLWLLLVYKVPPKPTSSRVYVWRKLKKLGALLWHDSVWILPANAKSKEHFQWLAAEIIEMGGEVQVWQADSLLQRQAESLAHRFQAQADDAFQAILEQLLLPEADHSVLSQAYLQAQQSDYFNSTVGERVRKMLLSARKGEREK